PEPELTLPIGSRRGLVPRGSVRRVPSLTTQPCRQPPTRPVSLWASASVTFAGMRASPARRHHGLVAQAIALQTDLSGRDLAVLLDLSHQRIHQLGHGTTR